MTDVTVAPMKFEMLGTKQLDSLIKSSVTRYDKLSTGLKRHSEELYLALAAMELRYEKRQRYRTDLKKLDAPTWHSYLVSRGVQPATFRKWKSRSAQQVRAASTEPNVVAAELVRDIASIVRKAKLDAVVGAAGALNPPIRKALASALKNAADGMLKAIKLLSAVKDPEAEGKCHQRVRREQMALLPDPDLAEKLKLAADFKANATVREISFEEAKPIILANEYLGTMNSSTQFCVGLFIGRFLAGVTCFGRVGGTNVAASICGKEHKDKVLTIVRGTCVHWAPKNAGSVLLSQACRLMADKGYTVICAFADPAANEVGTLYSAANFDYCGMTTASEQYITPDGQKHDSRQVHSLTRDRKGGKLTYIRTRAEQKALLLKQGCRFEPGSPKHRYILFSGSNTEKRELRKALRWEIKPYPKRHEAA